MINRLVSIIVPVYNVENYLDRCMNSIVSQSYGSLEIIMVDDGSNDNSSRMCDEWGKRDKRIKVVHKSNQGLGEARNTGIECAHGDYVCFVDSDDYIDIEMVEQCISFATENDLDIVSYGFVKEQRHGKVIELVPKVSEVFFYDENVYTKFLPMLMVSGISGKHNNLQISLCASFIKSEVIKRTGWKCESERKLISEDMYSLLKLYVGIKSVGIIKKSFYHYCENSTSLTHTFRSDRFEKNKYWYVECKKLCDKIGYDADIKSYITDQFFSNIIALIKMSVGEKDIKEKDFIKEIVDDEVMREVIAIRKTFPDTKKRKIFLWAMDKKMYGLCIWIAKKAIRG